MINYLFGLFTGGGVPEGTPGYRFTTKNSLTDSETVLYSFLTDNPVENASIADLFIRLMRSSPEWAPFILHKDPVNTYDVEVKPLPLIPECTDKLFKWADECNIYSQRYPINPNDDKIQRLISLLYTIASKE